MSLKKIAFLKSAISQSGGLEKYCKALMQGFRAHGCEVVLLTTDATNDKGLEGIKVVDFGRRSKCSFYHLLRFDLQCKKYLKNNPCDVVFGFDRNFCLQTHYRAGNGVHAAYLTSRKKTCSFLKRLSFSINPLHRLILQMEKKTYENPKLQTLFCNSHMVKKEILEYYPKVPERKINVVHNGVEWQKFSQAFEKGFSERSEIAKDLGLNPEKYQFLFIGHEYKRKGLLSLLKALSLLPEKKWQLSVVGKERSLETFSDYAKNLGILDKVFFFGSQKDVIPFYQIADCFVLPSLYDPFANVTLEALAMGLFVVTTNTNGAAEIISPMNGCVVENQNAEELKAHLHEALQRPKILETAKLIRNSVQYLDFSNQISKIIHAVLSDE